MICSRFFLAMTMVVAAFVGTDSRMAYVLPDGSDILVANLKTTFKCDNRPYGYYADVDNDCKIFHVCQPIVDADANVSTVDCCESSVPMKRLQLRSFSLFQSHCSSNS